MLNKQLEVKNQRYENYVCTLNILKLSKNDSFECYKISIRFQVKKDKKASEKMDNVEKNIKKQARKVEKLQESIEKQVYRHSEL